MADLVIFSFPVHIPFLIAALDGLTLIIFALSFCQRQNDFDLAPFEIEPEGNQGVAFFIDLAIQPLDFMFVQKQFSRS